MLAAILTLMALSEPAAQAAGPAASVHIDFMPGLTVTARGTTRGNVLLTCQVRGRGVVEHCDVTGEWPQGKGLGKAALKLQSDFEFTPVKGGGSVPVAIFVAFRSQNSDFDQEAFIREKILANKSPIKPFGSSATYAEDGGPVSSEMTLLKGPVLVAVAGADDLARAYPAKGGGVEGLALSHCRVARDGTLDACQIIKEGPEGRDFGKAALSLAAKFRVDPAAMAQAPETAPVWIDLPIRFAPPAGG